MNKKLTKQYLQYWHHRAFLYLKGFLTEAENAKVKARINKWAVKEELKERK